MGFPITGNGLVCTVLIGQINNDEFSIHAMWGVALSLSNIKPSVTY